MRVFVMVGSMAVLADGPATGSIVEDAFGMRALSSEVISAGSGIAGADAT